VGRSRLPCGLASHHVAAFDSPEFAQVEGERLAGDVAVQRELRHAGFHALGAVDAVHHLVFAPGLVHVRDFAEADRFVESDGLVEVGDHAAVEFNADDSAFAGPELRRGD